MLKSLRKKASQKYDQFSQKYVIQERAGEGAYGLVSRAVERNNTSNVVAVKTFKSKIVRSGSGEGVPVTVCREINLLRELKHENIVGVKDVILHPISVHDSPSHSPGLQQPQPQQRESAVQHTMAIVFEYCKLDLERILKRHREECKVTSDIGRTMQLSHRLEPEVVKSIMWQILHGIHYLHKNSVIHRDLKPANILINSDGVTSGSPADPNGVVKIGDFGLARVFAEPLRPLGDDGPVVTIWYRAPEILLGARHYTPAIDMWSVGCIFGELLRNQPLFEGRDAERTDGNVNSFQEHQLKKIFSILGTPTVDRWPTLSKMAEYPKTKNMQLFPHDNLANFVGLAKDNPAYQLLSAMLSYDPMKRITAEEALKHPYFKTEPLPTYDIFATRKPKFRYPDNDRQSSSRSQRPQVQQQQQQYRQYQQQQQQQQRYKQQRSQHHSQQRNSSSSRMSNAPFALSGQQQQQQHLQQSSNRSSYHTSQSQFQPYHQQYMHQQNRGQKRTMSGRQNPYPPNQQQQQQQQQQQHRTQHQNPRQQYERPYKRPRQ